MRMRQAGLTFGAALMLMMALPLSGQGDALAMSCGNSIVSTGDSKAEVILKCGEPAWKENREEEVRERLENGAKKKTTIAVEEWIYDLGPQSFLRILEFRDGTLTDIRTGGYGYGGEERDGLSCDEHGFNLGDTRVAVLMQCGEPFWRDQRTEELIEKQDNGTDRKTTVLIEEWTYNFGPNRFMRIITFRNGAMSDVRTGGYGR